MVEPTVEATPASPATPVRAPPVKKKATAKAKSTSVKTKVAAPYPATSAMVIDAIKTLNERGGSSLQAIKKSISEVYKVETEKFSLRIRKFLKSAVEKGDLIQTKGKGANGSFKLPPVKPEPKKKPAASAASKKPAAPKKEKAVILKKAKTSPKKSTTVKKEAKPKAASKAEVVTSPKKAPSKAKITKSTPVKKVKSPKPKKVVAKKPAVKKTTVKK